MVGKTFAIWNLKKCIDIVLVCFVCHFDFTMQRVLNHICSVMVVTSSAADLRFKSWLAQTKDFKSGICCFSDKLAAQMITSKD